MITAGSSIAALPYKTWTSAIYRPGLISGFVDLALATGASSGIGRYATIVDSTLGFIPSTFLTTSANPCMWAGYGTLQTTYQPLTFYFSRDYAFQVANFFSGTSLSSNVALPPNINAGTNDAPKANPGNAIMMSSPEVDISRWHSGGLGNSVSPNLVHEFGHTIDQKGRFFTDGVWRTAADTYPEPRISLRSEWDSIYARLMAKSPNFTGAPYLTNYYRTNQSEWFAELFMVRCMTNLRAGETWAYCSADSGASRCHPYMLKLWCAGDTTLYNDMMSLFSATFPSLSNPSPAWDGWGAPA